MEEGGSGGWRRVAVVGEGSRWLEVTPLLKLQEVRSQMQARAHPEQWEAPSPHLAGLLRVGGLDAAHSV